MTFGFLDSDELRDIRAELESLTEDMATGDAGCGPLSFTASPEEARARQFQLLLVHLQAQNRRAKTIVDELRAAPAGQKAVTRLVVPAGDLPIETVTIDLFEGYMEVLE
jgi:hypothetical protein